MAAALPILTVVGTGISAWSQYSAGQAQSRIANFNFAVESANARLNLLSQRAALSQQRAQNEMAMRQAAIARQAAESEAVARERNAQLIRRTADAKTAASREEIRRKRLEYARFQATQRNRIAAGGVIDTSGSPLELLAETAGQMQLAVEEMHQQANLDFVDDMNRAELEDYGARSLRAGAAAQFGVEAAAAKIRESGFATDAARIRSGYRADLASANIGRMVAFNNASGQKMAAAGTLLSGVGSYYQQRETFRYSGVS